jgi:hypothetical protein
MDGNLNAKQSLLSKGSDPFFWEAPCLIDIVCV